MGRTKGSEAGNLSASKRDTKSKDRGVLTMRSGFDGPLNAPWRKTVSIFKQPVTLVHTTSRDTRVANNEQLKRGNLIDRSRMEKPRQLYWAKSLESLRAMVPVCSTDRLVLEENEHIEHGLDLAGKMGPALSVVGDDASAASLFSALNNTIAAIVTGQTASKKQFEANPISNIMVDQPFIQAITITEQDLLQQEKRVLDMRRRLQEARRYFSH